MMDYTNLLRMLKTYEDGYGLYLDSAVAIEELQARLGEAENSVERWKDMYLTKHEPKMEVQE